jgi:aminocarboxymuconate-semialdehyde decarboxylase
MQSAVLAVRELERCKTIGLRGIEIGTNINDINLNEPEFDSIFAAAEQLDMAIFVHPWQMMGTKQMSKYWLPWLVGMPAESSRAICSMIFGGVFERYKKLRVAFAHGGGSFPATIGRIEQGYRVRPDLTAIDNDVNPRDYLGRFYVDSLIHDVPFLEFVIKLLGEDRVMIGSDYPFPLGEDIPGSIIEELNLSTATKDKLNYLNAQEWLGVR